MSDLKQWASAWLLGIAQEVKERPQAWTKYAYARDSSGRACEASSPTAECWCAEGFLRRDGSGTNCVLNALSSVYPARLLRNVNDDLIKSPEQFCAWFTRAAEVVHQFTRRGERLLKQAAQ